MKIIEYGLRLKKTGELLRLHIEDNGDAEDCGEFTYRLCDYCGNRFSVSKPEIAEYVRQFSTPWYNSSEETPEHSYEPDELENIKK